jgi:hypothetical protein
MDLSRLVISDVMETQFMLLLLEMCEIIGLVFVVSKARWMQVTAMMMMTVM